MLIFTKVQPMKSQINFIQVTVKTSIETFHETLAKTSPTKSTECQTNQSTNIQYTGENLSVNSNFYTFSQENQSHEELSQKEDFNISDR